MSDVAISGLTALGGAPATNDLLVVVDVSDTTQAPTGTTKKMTVANLFTSPTITGTATLAAMTATTGSFSVLLTVSGSGVAAVVDKTAAAGTLGHYQIKRSGIGLGWLGSQASDQVAILSADAGTVLATWTNAGDFTLTGALAFAGNLAIATNKFTVAASTGNTVAAGSMTATDHIAGSANAFQWTSRSKITSPADGNILLQNAAASAFTQLQFGGTTSAFPSLKRVSTGLVAQLADNSASASFQCQYINTDTPAGGTGAGLWKLGLRVASAVALVTTQYIEVDIGGTLYKLATVS